VVQDSLLGVVFLVDPDMVMVVTQEVDTLDLMEITRDSVTYMCIAIIVDVDALALVLVPHTMAVVADEGFRDN
jgi:hypothetical protein